MLFTRTVGLCHIITSINDTTEEGCHCLNMWVTCVVKKLSDKGDKISHVDHRKRIYKTVVTIVFFG